MRVGDALKHCHTVEVLESYQGEREIELYIREDELGEDIKVDLNIRDSLNYIDKYYSHNGDNNCDDIRLSGKMS